MCLLSVYKMVFRILVLILCTLSSDHAMAISATGNDVIDMVTKNVPDEISGSGLKTPHRATVPPYSDGRSPYFRHNDEDAFQRFERRRYRAYRGDLGKRMSAIDAPDDWLLNELALVSRQKSPAGGGRIPPRNPAKRLSRFRGDLGRRAAPQWP